MARGVGVGYRLPFSGEHDLLLKHVDFLEYNQMSNLDVMKRDLQPFLAHMPVVIHSLNLSLGSVEPPPEARLHALQASVKTFKPSWVSEHLSYSRAGDIEIDSFIALPYTDEAIEIVAAHIRDVQSLIGCPMAMENITHDFIWPGAHYSEAEFIKRVSEQADCGLLLDVTNLYLNSKTHGYDPYQYLETLPHDRIMQLHLAGHTEINGERLDTHVGGIHQKVLELADWVMKHTSCEALVIERDSDLNSFRDLLDDLQICRELYAKYRPTAQLKR